MKKRLLSLLLAVLFCLSLAPAALAEAEPAAEPEEEPAADGLRVYDAETEDVWVDVTVDYGEEKTLRVGVDTDDPDGIVYRWYITEYNEEYGAFADSEIIEGAESDTYTFTADRHVMYSCLVRDSAGNEDETGFFISIQNHLRAFDADSGEEWADVYVPYDGTAVLRAAATADDVSVLTYGWYSLPEQRLLSTEQTYTVSGVTEAQRYMCVIRDRFGNSASVYYDVGIGNGLQVDAVGDNVIRVPPGGSATMAVTVTANDMSGVTYQWGEYRVDEDGNGELVPIEGATGTSYTAENITATAQYECEVTDRYNTRISACFYIEIDSGLEVWSRNSPWHIEWDNVTAEKGQTVSLGVDTNADDPSRLVFTWYEMIREEELDAWFRGAVVGHGDTYEAVAAGGVEMYECVVRDSYGTEYQVHFTVQTENHFMVHTRQNVVAVKAGGDVELEVTASADTPVTYRWFRGHKDAGGGGEIEYNPDGLIAGETSPVLSVKNVRQTGYYVCEVTDGFETVSLGFTVTVDIGLKAFAAGTQDSFAVVYAPLGEKAALAVDASVDEGGLTYAWYARLPVPVAGGGTFYDEKLIPGADGRTVETEPVTAACAYECRVTDMNGLECRVMFDVRVQDHFSLGLAGDHIRTMERHPYFPEAVETSSVFAAPGETVRLTAEVHSDAAGNGTAPEVTWYAFRSGPEGGGPMGTGDAMEITVEGDLLLMVEAENAYGEWNGMYVMIRSLDADRDGGVDAADAAAFLARGGEVGVTGAVKVLQYILGLG